MAAPKKNYKVGNVQMARWEKDFTKDGKTTTATSFTMKKQKYNQDSKEWEDTDFLTVTDLKDLIAICQQAIVDHYGLNVNPEEAF